MDHFQASEVMKSEAFFRLIPQSQKQVVLQFWTELTLYQRFLWYNSQYGASVRYSMKCMVLAALTVMVAVYFAGFVWSKEGGSEYLPYPSERRQLVGEEMAVLSVFYRYPGNTDLIAVAVPAEGTVGDLRTAIAGQLDGKEIYHGVRMTYQGVALDVDLALADAGLSSEAVVDVTWAPPISVTIGAFGVEYQGIYSVMNYREGYGQFLIEAGVFSRFEEKLRVKVASVVESKAGGNPQLKFKFTNSNAKSVLEGHFAVSDKEFQNIQHYSSKVWPKAEIKISVS